MLPSSTSAAPLASPEYYERLGRLQDRLRDRYGLLGAGAGAGSGPGRRSAGALTPVPFHSPRGVSVGLDPPTTPPKFQWGLEDKVY